MYHITKYFLSLFKMHPKNCDKCGLTLKYYTTGRKMLFFLYTREKNEVMKLFEECIKMCYIEFVTSLEGTPEREKYMNKQKKIALLKEEYEDEKQKEYDLIDEENETNPTGLIN